MKKIEIWANIVNKDWTLTIDDEDITSGDLEDLVEALSYEIEEFEKNHQPEPAKYNSLKEITKPGRYYAVDSTDYYAYGVEEVPVGYWGEVIDTDDWNGFETVEVYSNLEDALYELKRHGLEVVKVKDYLGRECLSVTEMLVAVLDYDGDDFRTVREYYLNDVEMMEV